MFLNVRSAVYCRVSTDSQTTDHQERELLEYVARRGWIAPQIFRDVVTGARSSRPGLDEMMALVRAGKLEAVVCVKLDRLGRSLIHLSMIISELQRMQVALICTSQGIDTTGSNPAAIFQLQVLCAVAEYERAFITERIHAGIKTARARGVRLGREPLNEAKLRPKALTLRAAGQTLRQIAAALEVSVGSAYKLCRAEPIEGG